MAHGLSCSAARGIFPDQGSNPCPLHWQVDSYPLRDQGSPGLVTLTPQCLQLCLCFKPGPCTLLRLGAHVPPSYSGGAGAGGPAPRPAPPRLQAQPGSGVDPRPPCCGLRTGLLVRPPGHRLAGQFCARGTRDGTLPPWWVGRCRACAERAAPLGPGVVSQLPPLGVGEEARPALRTVPVLGAPFSAFSLAENRRSVATRARAPPPVQKARAYRTQVSQPGRIAGPHVLLSPGLVASPVSPGPLLVVLAFSATGAPVLSGLFGF